MHHEHLNPAFPPHFPAFRSPRYHEKDDIPVLFRADWRHGSLDSAQILYLRGQQIKGKFPGFLLIWLKFILVQLKSIPTIGGSGFISSYLSRWKFVFNGHNMVQEGYNKFYGSAFKVATSTHSQWTVVVTSPQMVEDIRRARDDQLSSVKALEEFLQVDYMYWPETRHDTYHAEVIRTSVTKNLSVQFADVTDEIVEAYNTFLPTTEDWTSVPLLETLIHIVCQTSNRLFVGRPLCQDPDYRSVNEKFTIQLITCANILNLFPTLLKPLVGRLLTKVPQALQQMEHHLAPIIQERLDNEEKYGPDWPGKPNDLLSWLLEVAHGSRRTMRDLAMRVIITNFAAIHTTSMTLTNVLYDLGAYPEYIEPLREEVESIINAHGSSKESMGKMRKLDSFIKESTRLAGFGAMTMSRKVLQDFTFSNGITVPAGATIAVSNHAMHYDESNYEDAHTFKGFRFAEMRDNESDNLESYKHQMVALTYDYLVFGHGRHACPGRFFAVNEMKAMLVHILMNYDLKLAGDGKRPVGQWFMSQYTPSRTAHVLFRKRQS